MKFVFASFLLFFLCLTSAAQSENSSKLKIFIDCNTGNCDRNYILSQIDVVDFLLDRIASDVHILITAQSIGSGRQYQLIFYGQHAFSNNIDTLYFITDRNATSAEIRESMVNTLKLGLVPFISKTPYANALVINMQSGDKKFTPPASNPHDKWNYWVFRLGLNGEINGETVYRSNRVSSDFSANRTTEKFKVEFYVYGSKRKSSYFYDDDSGSEDYEVKNSDYGFYHNIVKSISKHWSYGYQANISNNTFSNFKSKVYFNPAIEYNIYPYSEVNNRFFVVRYGLDATHYNYFDTTVYNKIDENLVGHRFSAALTLNQKWGTFRSGIFYRNFFKDWALKSMGATVNVNVRVTGGLSFFLNSSASIIHDQVYLVKGAATEQEILTRRRQLGSSYNYHTSFGINYRFGSKLNNFVNPRFDGYGGF